MSEEQPKQPEQQQMSADASEKSSTTRPSSAATSRDRGRDRQPAKGQGSRSLQGTIQALKGLVRKKPEVQSPPAPPTVRPATFETIVSPKSEAVGKTTEVSPQKPSAPAMQQPSKTTPSRLQIVLTWLTSGWVFLVRQVRLRLPASLSQQLPDSILSGTIAAILIIVMGIGLTLLPGKTPKVVATVSSPSQQPIIIPTSEPIVTLPSSDSLPSTTAELPEVISPEQPQPIEIAPPPPIELTPEQYLIATIQKQVAEITNQFGGGLVQSLQANFPGSLLTVMVSNDWYGLSKPDQNQLANNMLEQAQKLDFSKLEITNLQGNLIARSPVIGSEMIILERKLKTTPT